MVHVLGPLRNTRVTILKSDAIKVIKTFVLEPEKEVRKLLIR